MATSIVAPIVEQVRETIAPGKTAGKLTMVENCLYLRELRLRQKQLAEEEERVKGLIEKAHPEDCEVRLTDRFILRITTVPSQRLNTDRVKAYLERVGKLKQFLVTGTSRRIEVKEG